MNLNKNTLVIFLFLFVIEFSITKEINENTTISINDFNHFSFPGTLKRNKRMLLFPGAGGVTKCTLGISLPVDTKDKVNWRTMNLAYSLQGNWVPLPKVIWPWARFHRSLIGQRTIYNQDGTHLMDGTREFAYTIVESFIDRNGDNGKQCVLRAICEAAKFPIKSKGIFDEVLHLFLTPNENEVNIDYIDAMLAGKYGVDCQRLYAQCINGRGLLDKISIFDN